MSRPIWNSLIWVHSSYFGFWGLQVNLLHNYGRFSKILNTSYLPKRGRQTVQTQTRLLLKKQSDQGLPCFAILTSILWIPDLITNILFENRKRIVFKILEHWPYGERVIYVPVQFCRNKYHTCSAMLTLQLAAGPDRYYTGAHYWLLYLFELSWYFCSTKRIPTNTSTHNEPFKKSSFLFPNAIALCIN